MDRGDTDTFHKHKSFALKSYKFSIHMAKRLQSVQFLKENFSETVNCKARFSAD